MLRPKLTLHVGEHALTNICHRHRLALLVCIPRRVHVSSFERHFHSIEIPFPIGSAPPRRTALARLADRRLSRLRNESPYATMNLMKLSRTGAKDVKSYGFDSNNDIVRDVSMSSEVYSRCVKRCVSRFE